mmetsp:Transcript_3070/g.5956  ORF Transcript_3070/g.5956 Transcript_3070/m.5956 type:complete len:84 (-) Transcript_3070:78-329(-)
MHRPSYADVSDSSDPQTRAVIHVDAYALLYISATSSREKYGDVHSDKKKIKNKNKRNKPSLFFLSPAQKRNVHIPVVVIQTLF